MEKRVQFQKKRHRGGINNASKTKYHDKTKKEAARKRGRYGGRPTVHSNEKKELAYEKFQENKLTVAEIAKTLGMERTTIYRYINKRNNEHAKATTIVS